MEKQRRERKNGKMELEQLTMPKRKAEKEFNILKQAIKQNAKLKREQIYKDLRKVYGHLQHGKKIVEINESFKKAGLNKDGDPKLAIVRADAKVCYCYKGNDGSAVFSFEREVTSARKSYGEIALPKDTYQWTTDGSFLSWREKYIGSPVPVIPAIILVEQVRHLLRNYHILWEVEEWKPVPPRDPILVKQLTPNLFGVLAHWNLTKIERAIIRGRIQ